MTGLRLTVLGASAVRPNPGGGACAGYLVEYDDKCYLVDCGPGVATQLLAHLTLDRLDGILLSHSHPDHCLDLVALRQALFFAPGPKRQEPLPLYIGPDDGPTLAALAAAFSDHLPYWAGPISLRVYSPEAGLNLGGLAVRFAPTQHYRPCWAMRFEGGGRSLLYTADTGPAEAVAALAMGVDLLLCESTLPDRAGFEAQWGHMSAGEAGDLARETGAGRLVLTHYFVEHDPDALVRSAAARCTVPVSIAIEGDTYDV